MLRIAGGVLLAALILWLIYKSANNPKRVFFGLFLSVCGLAFFFALFAMLGTI